MKDSDRYMKIVEWSEDERHLQPEDRDVLEGVAASLTLAETCESVTFDLPSQRLQS